MCKKLPVDRFRHSFRNTQWLRAVSVQRNTPELGMTTTQLDPTGLVIFNGGSIQIGLTLEKACFHASPLQKTAGFYHARAFSR